MKTLNKINNYITRQANWIKANNLEIGNTVLVLSKHKSHTKGWANSWIDLIMEPGKILTIKAVTINGILCSNKYAYKSTYPYTILLPLPGSPEEYAEKTFISGKDGQRYKCIVHLNSLPNINEFGWQENGGSSKPILRKINNYTIPIDEMYKTSANYGYYPVYSNKICKYKIIASELPIPWLPQLKY